LFGIIFSPYFLWFFPCFLDKDNDFLPTFRDFLPTFLCFLPTFLLRNPQPATFGGNKSEKLISFCLAHIGRLLLTLHEKKKTTPEKEWVYPELGFMS